MKLFQPRFFYVKNYVYISYIIKDNNMKSSIKINPSFLLIAILSFALFYYTAAGTIQNYIHFAGVENEMAFALVGLMGTVLGVIGMFEKVQK